jgi:hypothetical protein
LLDVPERVFHFGPDAGFNLLGLQLIRIQLLASARALGNELGHIFTMLMLSPFLDAQVTGGFVRQTIQLQASEAPHGFDLVQRIFHRRITEVVKELHAVNPQHGRQRVRWPTVLALGVVMSHLLLQLTPGNQLVHSFQKDLAALLVLVLGFGEGYLAHSGGKSYAVSGGYIIADFGKLFRGSLSFSISALSIDLFFFF